MDDIRVIGLGANPNSASPTELARRRCPSGTDKRFVKEVTVGSEMKILMILE